MLLNHGLTENMILSSIENGVARLSTIFTNISKLSIPLGGLCVVFYSLRIGYFPRDLSLSDGLLFTITAACFGMVYATLLLGLTALAVSFAPLLKRGFGIALRLTGIRAERAHVKPDDMIPFHWAAPLLAAFGFLLIILLGRANHYAYLTLPLVSITLYLYLSLYVILGNRIKEATLTSRSAIHIEDVADHRKNRDVRDLQNNRLIALTFVAILPLFLGGVSGQLLDSAMSVAHVRIENATVYVKEPYSTLIPMSLQPKAPSSPRDYSAFENVQVLFTGFGKSTVVAYPKDGKTVKLEIPNDQVIIEGR